MEGSRVGFRVGSRVGAGTLGVGVGARRAVATSIGSSARTNPPSVQARPTESWVKRDTEGPENFLEQEDG